jgi:transcriptional regulator with XRE-family HTH domain
VIQRRPARRQRPTDDVREAHQRSTAIAASLGRDVRAARRGLGLRQADLALRVGVHQTWISDIELGRGSGAPLALWVAIGVAIGRPLSMAFTRPLAPGTMLADAGHLEMQEAILAIAAASGRQATVERPSNPLDPRHSSDVAIRDDPRRALILVEAWNTFGDVGAAIRSTQRKHAETSASADAELVSTVWVVKASAANRAILSRYPNLFAAAFDGSSRDWVRALVDGGSVPSRPGLVWFDAATRKIIEWRHP